MLSTLHYPTTWTITSISPGTKPADAPLPLEFAQIYPHTAHIGFGQDVEIWKDKVDREEPILYDGGGPINKLRRWFEQFY